MVFRSFITVLLILFGAPDWGAAQTDGCTNCNGHETDIAQLIQQADRLHAEFKPKEAAAELEKIVRVEPRNVEALAKLSRAHIDIGDSIPEAQSDWKERRIQEYRSAESYARKAIKADPSSTWGHFYLAASLGTLAGISPVATQVDMAEEIRAAAAKAIALDPNNGFAYHVYGVWHRRMAEIGKMSRMFASLWYGRTLPKGDLGKSVEFLKKAVSINPTVIVSRFELAHSYVAREDWPAARAMLKSIADLPARYSDDAKHKRRAQELLEKISDR
jgi:tetratricopeptide (TPR) repeat protein